MYDWLGTKHALLLGFSGLFWLQCINENANEERKNRGGEVDAMLIPARLNISMFRTVISYLSKHTYAAKVIPSLII